MSADWGEYEDLGEGGVNDHYMEHQRCKYCGYLITMPCQKPACVEAKRAERAEPTPSIREVRQFRSRVYAGIEAAREASR
ncbi:MAG: hypothetical protein V3T08_09210 [Gemmatimonadota bacterium]